jgi:predicted metalloprotease with PDZ domain
MWRGALSAPDSIYVHADRPLLSENATSTILHETVHVGLHLAAATGADWIVEGLAEYYSLEMLRRSGTISDERYRDAHAELESWGREVRDLCTRRSSGSNTARAVSILSTMNGEIRKASRGKADIDDVLRALATYDRKITVTQFRKIAAEIAGRPVEALASKNLPGCSAEESP